MDNHWEDRPFFEDDLLLSPFSGPIPLLDASATPSTLLPLGSLALDAVYLPPLQPPALQEYTHKRHSDPTSSLASPDFTPVLGPVPVTPFQLLMHPSSAESSFSATSTTQHTPEKLSRESLEYSLVSHEIIENHCVNLRHYTTRCPSRHLTRKQNRNEEMCSRLLLIVWNGCSQILLKRIRHACPSWNVHESTFCNWKQEIKSVQLNWRNCNILYLCILDFLNLFYIFIQSLSLLFLFWLFNLSLLHLSLFLSSI